jgi:hypothetical protein
MTKFIIKLYGQYQLPAHSGADTFSELPLSPPRDSVLCRDGAGNPTATYDDIEWNFTPYNFLPGRSAVINFGNVFDRAEVNDPLVEEVKQILFFLMYAGYEKDISVTTLISHYKCLKSMAKFCKSYEANVFVGNINIKTLLTNQVFLKKYIEVIRGKTYLRRIQTIASYAANFPRGFFSQPLVKFSELKFELIRSRQVPVIPSRIYINLIDRMSVDISHIYDSMHNLDTFISCFSKPGFGVSHKAQREKYKIKRDNFLETFDEAVDKFELGKLFIGRYEATSKKELIGALTKMQYLVKNVIHLYTGMRDQEVSRLKLGCLKMKEVEDVIKDDNGVIHEPAKFINIISTTTKHFKCLRTESWLAPAEVIKAIEIAEKICGGLTALIGKSAIKDSTYLFLSASLLNSREHEKLMISYFSKLKLPVSITDEFRITQDDFDELCLSDPNRDFTLESQFCVGKVWSAASHQYRRSLAYYASRSGFVSQLSLKRQFKHTCILMTQYYGNNFQNFKSIFGYFDDDVGESVLPGTHVAYEFQLGMSAETVNQILSCLQDVSTIHHGGAGALLEREKNQLGLNYIDIIELRSTTERAVKYGERSYRKTLLGGCAKLGPCENFMLGDITACLSCESSVLDEEKTIATKMVLENEILQYPRSSGEFQVCQTELKSLTKALARFQNQGISYERN